MFDGGVTVIDNYMWHAARGFFEEGGKRLYISRTWRPASSAALSGYALGSSRQPSPPAFRVRARFPGDAGNGRVTFTLKVGQNILVQEGSVRRLRSLSDRDVVCIRDRDGTLASPSTQAASSSRCGTPRATRPGGSRNPATILRPRSSSSRQYSIRHSVMRYASSP